MGFLWTHDFLNIYKMLAIYWKRQNISQIGDVAKDGIIKQPSEKEMAEQYLNRKHIIGQLGISMLQPSVHKP